MAGFTSNGSAWAAWDSGKVAAFNFRKMPSQATTSTWWADLSMAAGSPPPQYYAAEPLKAGVIDGWKGIFHGANQAPAQKYLLDLGIQTQSTSFVGHYKLLDYILAYPFIDLSESAYQPMTNTVSLPRYADGISLSVMFVANAPTVGGGTFTFNYIDDADVERTSPVQTCVDASVPIASLITSKPAIAGYGPFLPLLTPSKGIKRITGYQQIVSDGGLGTLVIVKSLADIAVREINTTSESVYVGPGINPPRIYDGAYLNCIVQCAGSIAGVAVSGQGNIVWN